MAAKRRPFPGGYRFRRFEGQPEVTLEDLGTPDRVIIPLKQGFGAAVRPVVGVGDKVFAGQIVGRGNERPSSPVHSSVNGVVEEIRAADPANGMAGAVVIGSRGDGAWQRLPGHAPDWQDASPETLEDLLYAAGVTALGGVGIPTRHGTAIISPDEVEHIIVHDTGGEMYHPSLPLLIGGEKMRRFADGLSILGKVMGKARIHVAIDEREASLIGEFSGLVAGASGINVCPVSPVYPHDFDELLVPALLGRPFPHGYTAAHIGVVTLDCQAVLHAYEAVAEGKPLIERVIALCGAGFRHRRHVRVRIGTPLAFVARDTADGADAPRLVKNSPLTGLRLGDSSTPIDRTFSCVIALPERRPQALMPFARPGLHDDGYARAFLSSVLPTTKKADTTLQGEARPCVSCGYCQDVCPAGILPHLLYKHVARGYLEERLVTLKIFDCIGCNLCSYVCPSKIAVAGHIRTGKAKLLEAGMDNAASVLPFFNLKGLNERPAGE